ncbi:lamin tail domain-containing protein 1 [Rhea pennata]|uniref:lamin tail domain-containing protein 1 n=1 Tax=Rhea pennata TaxID=8795 RepID=UPI002E2544AF
MSSIGSSRPASAMGTTEASSLVRSADLTQASWRRAIAAQPKGPVEILDRNPVPSRNIHPSFADQRKIAQSLGSMDNHGRMHSVYDNYQKSAFSAIGNLKIVEVHPGGLFVKILNCAPEKEESIGDYLLMQNIQGQPVAVFRFPPKIRMAAGSVVTVWSADAKVLHRPPSDFLWKDLERFRSGLSCATILCEPRGQAVAWYTPLYCNGRQGWVAREERENLENIIKLSSSTTKLEEGWGKGQEPTMTDTEWKRADPGQTRKKRQSFIKREEEIPASLFPHQSAWCQSPDAPTHPHFSLLRPLTMGNDGSSFCRQSRSQSARPDPVPGTLYAGTSQRRNPSAPSCVNGKDRRRPTRSAGPNFGGVMYIGSRPPAGTALQKYFVTPSYSFMLQTHHFLQLPVQNL